ncbi:germination protein YpeB [Haloimpatiens lingqiaonensis]|uniref:germination protein YpeB n=1 Tax=Haloimpatiens lingqiaonensis TaxID=1380675 RepID=UPI0010FF38F2|nr:germination protein YpeB [Haloimpatiens lingqiaonensis]
MKSTRKRMIYTIISTFIVVFSTTFAILMTLERTDYRNYLQGEYSKNMYQLINSVQNIRTNLGKSSIVGSKEQSMVVFSEIFRHTSIANDKLHSMPIQQQDMDKTSRFLSQVGDFCYTLTKNISEGKELTDKDYENIDLLELESYELEQRLARVVDEINEGKVKWGEIRKKTSGVLAKSDTENAISTKFTNIQKQIVQYPALIYDGPFSDNLMEIKPKVYKEKKISADKAKNYVVEIIGKDKIQNINLKGEENKVNIDSYRFEADIKGDKNRNIICEVSKNGGRIVYLLDNKNVGKDKINIDKAVEYGKNFLEKSGYKNMEPSYTLKYDSTALINYVYKQGDVTVYPDQIKLKIALDNGDIIGIESEKYLISHEEGRKIPKPKISLEEARKKVGKRLAVDSTRLAIIPTETNKEVLCYEFKGNYKDKQFIVYINALTGYEERIIQIINTPNGNLTI